MTSNAKNILKGFAIGIAVIGGVYLLTRKKKSSDTSEKDTSRNIIIGDSQTPFISSQSKDVTMLGKEGGESNLWLGGMGLAWLKNAVSKYPVSKDVKNVVINIGTNDGFNKNSDVKGLINELKRVFPNAKLSVVQGSWGWGNNVDVTNSDVKTYYDKYKQEGVKVINPPIGVTDNPHTNLPVYKEIGKSIDAIV